MDDADDAEAAINKCTMIAEAFRRIEKLGATVTPAVEDARDTAPDPQLWPAASPLAREIHRRMRATGLSAIALSSMIGANKSYFRDLFEGRARTPNLKFLPAIAAALGCEVSDLLQGTEREAAAGDEAESTAPPTKPRRSRRQSATTPVSEPEQQNADPDPDPRETLVAMARERGIVWAREILGKYNAAKFADLMDDEVAEILAA
jgi:transcriptional regulator with XRE-family HTH domain